MKKLSLVQIPFWNDHLTSYLVYMFQFQCDITSLDWQKITHPVPIHGEANFIPKWVVYSLLTMIVNTFGRFSTKVISCCRTGIEVNPCQFDLFRYFSGGVMTCNQKQSHEREPGLTTSTVVFEKVNIYIFIYKMKVSSRAETFQDVSLPIPGKNDTYMYLFVVNHVLWSNLYYQHLCMTTICLCCTFVVWIVVQSWELNPWSPTLQLSSIPTE